MNVDLNASGCKNLVFILACLFLDLLPLETVFARNLSFPLGHHFGVLKMGLGEFSTPTTGSKWKGTFCTFLFGFWNGQSSKNSIPVYPNSVAEDKHY